MKLAIITATCRTNPRYAEMARTLFASFRRAPTSTELEWILVDERLWWTPREERFAEIREALDALPLEVQSRIVVNGFAPPPSAYRGPDVSDPLPAHNTARNAGLAALSPDIDYVVFLSDCAAVTQDWVSVALDIATRGFGWKCRFKEVFDHVIPKDVPLRYQDCWDNLHPVLAATVAGPCWGVPKEALTAVVGFDVDYDGEDDLYDHEILIRLDRVGVAFVTTKRAGVVRMNRTRLKSDVTTRRETLRATRNQAYYQMLTMDRGRFLPGAAAAAGHPQLGGGAADRAARPAPTAPPARVAPLATPGRFAVAPRAPADMPAPARAGDDAGGPAPGVAAGAVTVTPPRHPGPRATFIAGPFGLLGQKYVDHTNKEQPMTARPMTLQEKAIALKAARQARAQAEANGTAPPLDDQARCSYVPTQGGHKQKRCLLKRSHGGGHAYEGEASQGPVRPTPPAPPPIPRDPPEPPAQIAAARILVDQHILDVAQLLESRPNDLAKELVLLAVILRREGVLANEQTFRAMVTARVTPGPGPDFDPPTQAEIAAEIAATLEQVQELCACMPPIPVSEADFRSLSAFTRTLDAWREQTGLPKRTTMPPFDRGYAAAGDMGFSIDPPDDVRQLDDELANLERATAAADDTIVSVEPLPDDGTGDAAAHEAMVAEGAPDPSPTGPN